jgi:hypothetical protein
MSKSKRLSSHQMAWTKFEEVHTMVDAKGQKHQLKDITRRCYKNSRYTVLVRALLPCAPFGAGFHLSIKLNDRAVIHDWRDLQRIKNEIVGPEVEAVELYPKNSRVTDTANQYHLWCFPEYDFPFGQNFREVMDRDEVKGDPDPMLNRAEQRPLDPTDPVHSQSTGRVPASKGHVAL